MQLPHSVRSVIVLLFLAGLLLLMDATFAFSEKPVWRRAGEIVINTGGAIEVSKCSPCHNDLDGFNNAKLSGFSHSTHFKRGIVCDACHTVWPHQPQGLVKPTMAVCANCHQLRHGSQGRMIRAGCDVCHPSGFKLKPDNHETGDFSESRHQIEALSDVQECLLCHGKEGCRSCHDRKGVDKIPSSIFRRYGLWAPPNESGIRISIGGRNVTMAGCQPCHLDLEQWRNDKLVNFNHAVHFKRQIKCENCHDGPPHQKDRVKRPKMEACSRCHRLDHGKQGPLVTAEKHSAPPSYCYLCHPRDMELEPGWHTVKFIKGSHKRLAKSDRGLCRGCHIQAFCDNCHQADIPHAPNWRGRHGSVAAEEGGIDGALSCLKCHKPERSKASYRKASSCAECHLSNVYPHEKPWAVKHGKAVVGMGRKACATCHRIKAFCNSCHKVKMPHDDKWMSEHPLFLRDNPLSSCLGCHKKTQCEQCHSIHGVHTAHQLYDLKRIE